MRIFCREMEMTELYKKEIGDFLRLFFVNQSIFLNRYIEVEDSDESTVSEGNGLNFDVYHERMFIELLIVLQNYFQTNDSKV